MTKRLTSSEMLEIMDYQWATVDDIMKLGSMGKTKAFQVKRNIEKKYKELGKVMPNNSVVEMAEVVDYLKIDIAYLQKMAKRKEMLNVR